MNIAGWEQRYRTTDAGAQDAPTSLVVETAAKLPPGIVIDLACGTGRNALYLSENGWQVTAVDGSETAIDLLRQRAAARGLEMQAVVADLTSQSLVIPADYFDLILVAYYLQRDLFPLIKSSVRPGGLILAIVHTPEPGEDWTEKRAAPGELRSLFDGWKILHDYEGPSRDPAHRRPVAEIVAHRPKAANQSH